MRFPPRFRLRHRARSFAASSALALALALVPLALATAADAHAGPARAEKEGGARLLIAHGVRAPRLRMISAVASHLAGRSIGSPTEGHLLGGAHLDDAPYLRVVPIYAAGDVRWGLESLVGALDRAARSVRKQYPDAVMSVGHLSRAGGGELDRHASHESGRDADVAFYVKSWAGKPLYADHFVPFKGDGTAPSWPGAHFDDARNWAFIAALVGDGRTHVSHIFVATPIRARLLAYGERIGTPREIRDRAAVLMVQPRGALPHDDHFHVRISCPAAMEGCIELPTSKSDRYARAHHEVGGAHGRTRTHHAVAAPAPAAPANRTRNAPGRSPRNVVDDEADLPVFPTPPPERDRERELDDTPPPTSTEPLDPPPASLSAPIDDVDGPISNASP